ncbi:VWA domain-containing protein [Sphingomonas sp. CJ20]
MRDVLPIELTLLHPELLWAALLLPLVWWKVGPKATLIQRALRTAVFGLLVLALAQPSMLLRRPGTRQIVILDARSGADGVATARRVLGRLHRPDEVTLVTLGAAPSGLTADRRIALPEAALSTALDRALAEIPPGAAGAVTVIGSGTARDAHWERAIEGLVQRGIPVNAVHTIATPRAPFLADLRIAPVRAGEVAQATIMVAGQGTRQRLRLVAGGRELAQSEAFDVDGEAQIPLQFPADQAGFLPLRAELSTLGAPAPVAALDAVAAVQDPLPLLYVQGRQQGAAPRLQQLLGKGFAVEPRAPASLSPMFDFTRYAAVMLDDVPARTLAPATQAQLLQAVAQHGTGLFYSGGAQAFGMGGYDGTPIARALPISLRQEDKLEQPSVALVIVIDTSGSMAGTPIELAKQVARFAVRKLGPMDSVGVVEFYGAKQWSVPLQPARDTAEVERAIGRMQAQGSSILFPAIQEAYFALKGSNARFKHILVISDAGVEEQRYQALLTHIADDRINVSTALVGADPEGEERMVQWARWGRGRYYSVSDEFSMVELNLKQPQDKPAPAYRDGAFATMAPAGRPRWHGIAMNGVPAVQSFVPTTRRDAAETLLTTNSGDTLLSSWQFGAGRITAMMTEPLGQGSSGWQQWSGYGAWLGRLIAQTANPDAAASLALERRFDTVTVTYRDDAGRTAAPEIRFVDPQGRAQGNPLVMDERAPGLYVGTRPLDPGTPALVEARVDGRVLRAADRAHSDTDGNPVLPLAALADRTGGSTAASGDASFAPRPVHGHLLTAVALGGWSALLALLLYLAELLYRRWPARRRPS